MYALVCVLLYITPHTHTHTHTHTFNSIQLTNARLNQHFHFFTLQHYVTLLHLSTLLQLGHHSLKVTKNNLILLLGWTRDRCPFHPGAAVAQD